MSYLVSIIIPIYNVKKYLDKCINSVLSQSYGNLQIILVDDGSTDGSEKVCDYYKEVDGRITVIHKPNGGLSDARNSGLLNAEGEFVFFLDSDDYLENRAIETLVSLQNKNNCDIVVSNYFYTYADHEDLAKCEFDNSTIFNNKDAMQALVTGKIQNFAWGKLIKTKIAKNCLFPKNKLFEDVFWAHNVFALAKNVCFTCYAATHYTQRENSISYSLTTNNLDVLDGWIERKIFLKKLYPELENSFLNYISKQFINLAWLVASKMKGVDKDMCIKKLRKFSKELQIKEYAKRHEKKIISLFEKNIFLFKLLMIIDKIKNKLGEN